MSRREELQMTSQKLSMIERESRLLCDENAEVSKRIADIPEENAGVLIFEFNARILTRQHTHFSKRCSALSSSLLLPCRAVINRYGFNSEGIVAVARRLGARHGRQKLEKSAGTDLKEMEGTQYDKTQKGVVGVNLGKNKDSLDAGADYVQGVHTLSQYADYLVINISSPNTPGLRKLQGRKQLQELIRRVRRARAQQTILCVTICRSVVR
jgi:hypothetical protein